MRGRTASTLRLLSAVIAVALLAAGLAGLGAVPAGAQTTISGTVRDSSTAAPMQGICIAFYDTGQGGTPLVGSVTTSDNGTYAFTPNATAVGPFDLAFYRPTTAFDCASQPATSDPFPVWYKDVPFTSPPPPPEATEVQAGTAGVDECLAPDAVATTCASPSFVSGHVVTNDLAPVAGACVFVIAGPPTPSGPASRAVTDASGNYRADGVPVNTDLVVGIVPPFNGPTGPCSTDGPPPPFPPGELQPVWYKDVWADLSDPSLGPDPFGAAVRAGATVIRAGRTDIDACLTNAPGNMVPRPSCNPAPPAAVAAAPRFTG